MRILAAALCLFHLSACTSDKKPGLPRPTYSTVEDRGKPELQGPEQFRLIDQFSTAHSLSDYKGEKSLFLIATKKECASGREGELVSSIAASGPVLLVTGTPKETYADYAQLKQPVLFDHWQFVLRRYELHAAGDFVEINPATGEVIKRGSVPLGAAEEKCRIYSGDYAPLDFTKDVLPNFANACLTCHIKYAGTDFFVSMPDMKRWSKMIARSLELYRMPPGGIDDHFEPVGKASSPESLKNLYQWVASGAAYTPSDVVNYAKVRREFVAKDKPREWARGKPDFVFTMSQPHTVPASGIAFYNNAQIAGPMPEDVWIKGAVFGHNLSVLHHSNLLISKSPISDVTFKMESGWNDTADQDVTQRLKPLKIKTLAGGKEIGGELINENAAFSISRTAGAVGLSDGTAAFIPKGSYLIVQNHYQPSGKPEENTSQVKLYKYPSDQPRKQIRRFFVRPTKFVIPPQQKNFNVESTIPIEKDVSLLDFNAHMHFRGRSAKLYATRPGQAKRLLISIPFFQFKFERHWSFKTPVFLEKGSLLSLVVTYDNSAQNIANPDPSLAVKFGASTYYNEMHSMRIAYVEGKM